MTKCRLVSLLITILYINISYGQNKRINISAHTYLSNSKFESTYNHDISKQLNFSLSPRISYRLNEVWAIGVGYHNTSNKFTLGDQKLITTNTVGLFVQSYLFDNDKIAAFLELDGNKGSNKSKSRSSDKDSYIENYKTNIFLTGIHAGVRYTIYKGLGAEVRLNNLIQYEKNSMKLFKNDASSFQVFENLLKNSSIGLSYQF